MGSTIKHAALSYARKGWKVFPISPNLKTPLAALAPQGHKNASSDQTTIEQWWSVYPNSNIGLNLEASGLVCVDVDSYKEDCGFNDFMVAVRCPRRCAKSRPGVERTIYSRPQREHHTLANYVLAST